MEFSVERGSPMVAHRAWRDIIEAITEKEVVVEVAIVAAWP